MSPRAVGGYISDSGNNRVEYYLASGGGLFLGKFTVSDAYGIAVNDGTGDIYVADSYDIKHFDAAGTYITQFGQSGAGALHSPRGVVVSASGDIFVSSSADNVIKSYLGADLVATPTAAKPHAAADQPPSVTAKGKKRILTAKGGLQAQGHRRRSRRHSGARGSPGRQKALQGCARMTSWTFKARLKPGQNKLTIRAVDSAAQASVL